MDKIIKPTERFSDRVANYIKYRPGYPAEMVAFLVSQMSSPCDKTCADFGSGTGIFANSLAEHFKAVYGIEPNPEMRSAGEQNLQHRANFFSLNATAEHSGLAPGSVDLITAAQAFHWFDQDAFQNECRRILTGDGWVALIWNNRLTNTAFLKRYAQLLSRYATDYHEVNHQNLTADQFNRFFQGGYRLHTFNNVQRFDFAGVLGRLDSSSYSPKPGTPEFNSLREELSHAFQDFSENGWVSFNYETQLYLGRVG